MKQTNFYESSWRPFTTIRTTFQPQQHLIKQPYRTPSLNFTNQPHNYNTEPYFFNIFFQKTHNLIQLDQKQRKDTAVLVRSSGTSHVPPYKILTGKSLSHNSNEKFLHKIYRLWIVKVISIFIYRHDYSPLSLIVRTRARESLPRSSRSFPRLGKVGGFFTTHLFARESSFFFVSRKLTFENVRR